MSRAPKFFTFLALGLLTAACGARSSVNPGGLSDGGAGGTSASQGVGVVGSGGQTISVGVGGGPAGSGGANVATGSGAGPSSSSVATSTVGSGPGTTASSGPGGGPVDCFQCIGSECPDALQCVLDPNCMQGVICMVSQCLSGGQPDFGCVLNCFNGDFQAAIEAFQSIGCVFTQCQDECGDLLGGGFPGSSN